MFPAMPSTRRVRSANDEFQLALALRLNRRQRQQQRRFVVEGVRAIDGALAGGWSIDAFWYAAGRPLSRWAESILANSCARLHVEWAPELMAELSGKDDPSELLAVAQIPPDDLGRIEPDAAAVVLVCDRLARPGNLGSLIRSADAFGADGVVVTGHAADVYDPQTVASSAGSLFSLPVVRAGSPEAVHEWIVALRARGLGIQLVGSSARAETAVSELDLSPPTVLVVGSETSGLSWGWKQRCDALVAIPIVGSATSLNVAAAASILLYEIGRQRHSRCVQDGTSDRRQVR